MSAFATAPRLASPSATEQPLYLYGAGNLGRLARGFLTAVGHEPAGIQRGDPSSGVDVRVAVNVVTSLYVTIERSLVARGCIDVVPFYDIAESLRGQHPLANGWFAAPLTAADQREIEGVLAGWNDDVSRAHHLQFLAWRRFREEWAFENAPVSADNGMATFSEGYGFASKLSAFGQAQVSTRSIDSLDVEPTFIKLHLESGEFDALRGASETLRADRPIVTAIVYRNADGLSRTSGWLMHELEDYRFLFRSRCWCGAVTVAYAIPREHRQ